VRNAPRSAISMPVGCGKRFAAAAASVLPRFYDPLLVNQ
jgi:hypothetical protein